jgi:hypothetical protein
MTFFARQGMSHEFHASICHHKQVLGQVASEANGIFHGISLFSEQVVDLFEIIMFKPGKKGNTV